MLIGGRRGWDRFRGNEEVDRNQWFLELTVAGWTTSDFHAAKCESRRRQTSACFSRGNFLIASTISLTVAITPLFWSPF
jgi:hypothetical protein